MDTGALQGDTGSVRYWQLEVLGERDGQTGRDTHKKTMKQGEVWSGIGKVKCMLREWYRMMRGVGCERCRER